MKKILLYALAASLMFCACDLTKIPEDSVSPDSYFKTETDFELWCNAFYTQFSTADNLAGMNADDVVDNNPQDCIKGSRSAATESWSWTQLRNINYLLEHSEQCADEAVRAKWEAVAYFFRAYFYSIKVRNYGDVPWYDEVIGSADTDNLQKARDSRGYVMYQVMKDYDRAIAGLPSTRDVATVNKWTALAFKSRAALYEGTFRKYHGIADETVDGTITGSDGILISADWFLAQAAEAAGKLIDEGPYTLAEGEDIYREMFVDESANTSEWILARVYGDIYTQNVRHNSVSEHQGFTKRFMNHYLLKDGSRITSREGYETETLAQEVKDRDPRLAQTVYCGLSTVKGDKLEYLTCVTGYQPIKFESAKAKNSSGKGTFDFPLMRLPEVMLNYAEAKAELGTLTQADLGKTINKIRARAGVTKALSLDEANADPDPLLESYYPHVNSGANKGVILEIRRERTVEFPLEGLRQWDMFRWAEGSLLVNHDSPYLGVYFPGPGVYDMNGDGKNDTEIYTGEKTSTLSNVYKIGTDIFLSDDTSGNVVAYKNVDYTWQEGRDYLWPIPAAQRVLNHNLTQNPGWADGLDF